MSVDDVLSKLQSTADGLSSEEAKRRLGAYGPNTLEEEHIPLWRRLLTYFWGPIPWMIEVAAVLSGIDRDWKSFSVIVAMLVINGGIGFWEENSAANALDALKGQLALKARVRRNGEWKEIEASDLVPGDIVRMRTGDVAPADAKLLEGDYLSIDQSALTGESLPVTKRIGGLAYSGTLIKEGEIVGVVYATDANTFFGRTAKLVEGDGAASHFQEAVLHIGNVLIASAAALSAILVLVEITHGVPLLMLLLFLLIVVVASIPVALPRALPCSFWPGTRLALGISLAKTQKLMFLRFIVGGHLLLFVTCTRHPFWKRTFPSRQLLSAIVMSQGVGLLFV